MTLASAPATRAADWPVVIVGVAAALSAIMVVGQIVFVCKKTKGLKWLYESAPSPKWSVESWAQHLIAVGAILGTALNAVALPESPKQIDKSTAIALSLAFGSAIVVAPFVYEAIRRLPSVPIAKEVSTGFVGVILLSCAIVFAGAFGELFTLGVVAWELTGGNLGGKVIEVLLGLLSLLAYYYVGVSAWEAAMTGWTESPDQPRQQTGVATPTPERTALSPETQAQTRSSWSLP